MDSISLNLREYVDARIEELEKRILAKLHATNDAVSKSERLLDVRLASMNEFRSQLTSQAGTFITRSELDLIIEREVAVRKSEIQALQAFVVALIVVVIGAFLALIYEMGG
jgi:hypothetical protein